MTTMNNPAFHQHLEALVNALEAFYNGLSQEQHIWFWISAAVVIVLVVGGTIFLLHAAIKGLNSVLQSDAGWKPIRFYTCMWAGTGIWAVVTAFQLRAENCSGWSVALAFGVVALIGFLWCMVRRLKLLRALGASVADSLIGVVLAPIVIQFGLLAILVVVGLLALSIWGAFQPQRVYVVNR